MATKDPTAYHPGAPKDPLRVTFRKPAPTPKPKPKPKGKSNEKD